MTFVCPPPEQCTIPCISECMVSIIFLITGAQVRVGESTSLPTSVFKPSIGSVSLYLPEYIRSYGKVVSRLSGYFEARYGANRSCRAEVRPLLPIPLLYSFS